MKELLLRLYNDLSGFSSESLIIVSYDKSTHVLTYRQLGKIVMLPYLKPYYLPKKGFEVGILNSTGYLDLMKGLKTLLLDFEVDKEGGSVTFSIGTLGLHAYKTYNSVYVVGPQPYVDLKLVNLTNRLIVHIIMRNYSNETKTLYKLIKNERKSKS